MLIAGIDLETTGLDQSKGHRIIEVCGFIYNITDFSVIPEPRLIWTKRINPQRSIDPKAQAVHHISFEELTDCPTIEELMPSIHGLIAKTDVFIAHNADFDWTFLKGEMQRLGYSVPNPEVFCTMENGRWATPHGKLPSLKELCRASGYEYDEDKAHAAEYDVDRMMKCFFKGVSHGEFNIDLTEVATREAA